MELKFKIALVLVVLIVCLLFIYYYDPMGFFLFPKFEGDPSLATLKQFVIDNRDVYYKASKELMIHFKDTPIQKNNTIMFNLGVVDYEGKPTVFMYMLGWATKRLEDGTFLFDLSKPAPIYSWPVPVSIDDYKKEFHGAPIFEVGVIIDKKAWVSPTAHWRWRLTEIDLAK